MFRRFVVPLLTLLGLSLLPAAAQAGTLVEVVPGGRLIGVYPVVGDSRLLGVCFSLDTTYTGVTIEAYLATTAANPPGTAFLTRSIGPGTTPADEVASAPVSYFVSPNPGFDTPPTVVFSGLTLGPGAYYFSVLTPVQGPIDPLLWIAGETVLTSGGNTFGGDFVNDPASPIASYPPASPLILLPGGLSGSSHFAFRVQGTAVPEPATLALMGLGALAWLAGAAVPRRIRPARPSPSQDRPRPIG